MRYVMRYPPTMLTIEQATAIVPRTVESEVLCSPATRIDPTTAIAEMALVNALAMMSPYGAPEKQAMLEAPDLKTRAEILIAVTEMDLAKKRTSGDTGLQ